MSYQAVAALLLLLVRSVAAMPGDGRGDGPVSRASIGRAVDVEAAAVHPAPGVFVPLALEQTLPGETSRTHEDAQRAPARRSAAVRHTLDAGDFSRTSTSDVPRHARLQVYRC